MPSNTRIVLRVRRRNRVPHVSTEEFDNALHPSDETGTHIVQLDNDEGVSYLRLATHVFSRIVELKRPCLNVVVIRQLADPKQRPSNTELGSYPDLNCESDNMWRSISADGYKFGDGTVEFFGKYSTVAVGGTFDRLHAGHRLLLTAASWAAEQQLVIGITGESLLERKQHKELIASFEERSRSSVLYAQQVNPSLPLIRVVKLNDPAGPTTSDPAINALVVSSETADGARRINEVRVAGGLDPMSIVVVDVLDTGDEKLSSSVLRKADLERRNLQLK